MKRVKFSRVRGSMRTSTVHYQKSLLGGHKNRLGGEGKGKKRLSHLSVPITQADFSRTPLYGHPLNIDPSFSLSLGRVLTFSLIQPLIILRKLNRLCGKRTRFSSIINQFSQKVNRNNKDTSLSTVCCNKPYFFLRYKTLRMTACQCYSRRDKSRPHSPTFWQQISHAECCL